LKLALGECGIPAEVLTAPADLAPRQAALSPTWLIEWDHPALARWGGAAAWCRAVLASDAAVRIAVLGRLNDETREVARQAGVSAFLDEPWLVRRLRAFLSPPPPGVAAAAYAPAADGSAPPAILLAEDNAINQRIATLMLTELHARLDVAQNGREAVERALNGAYDLILMDLQMPEMGGIDATLAIRAAEQAGGRRRVPICALTAGVLNNERERCLQSGMDDFLSKPIMKAQLIEVCRRWISGNPEAE
jgi:CheY-like chemotaxis protein